MNVAIKVTCLILFLSSCSKSTNCDSKELEQKIGASLNNFELTGDTTILVSLLKKIDSCDYQNAFYPAKLRICVLLEDYESALKITNSLKNEHFDFPYQKEMHLLYYKYQIETDPDVKEIIKDKLEKISLSILNNHLNEQGAMLDFLAIEMLISSKSMVLNKLDSLEPHFSDTTFFKILRVSAEDWPEPGEKRKNMLMPDQSNPDTTSLLPF